MHKLLIFAALLSLSLATVHGLSKSALHSFGGSSSNRQYNSFGGQQQHHSAASSDDVHAETRSFHSDVRHDGFDYALETTNGIHAVQSGDDHGNVHGDYEYVSPEGVHVKVVYVADENGYQPQSDLLPTPPPIPAAILKSLEYIRTHPPHEDQQNYGSSSHGGASSHYNAPAASHHRSSAFGRHH